MSKNGNILAFPDLAALDAEAAAWVARFDAGEVSAQEQAEFQAWLNRSPLHRQAIAEFGKFWSEFDKLGQLTQAAAADSPTPAGRSLGGMKYWLAASAAAVLMMVAAGGVLKQESPARPQPAAMALTPSGPQSYATAVGAQKKFALADGTVVMLNTNSRIEVNFRPHGRDVRLIQGEAYFEVVHDKARPFTVCAHRYEVRDIGTAFAVHLLDRGMVNVRVTKGSVEVAAPARRGAADGAKSLGIFAAGHEVVFGRKTERTQIVSDAELSRKLAWRQGQLIYSGQKLADVLADVSRYTDIEIELADPALRDLPVGGAFNANQTEAIIAALENNFGIRAEWTDAHHVRLVRGKDTASN